MPKHGRVPVITDDEQAESLFPHDSRDLLDRIAIDHMWNQLDPFRCRSHAPFFRHVMEIVRRFLLRV